MSRVPMTQAVAADYADAMLVARRAKNALFYLLALVLLIQTGIFFAARYVPNLKIHAIVTTPSDCCAVPTTMSATLADATADATRLTRLWSPTIQYVIPATDFLGIILSMALSVLLLILIMIMLVGRLVGVSHVTSAFCWSVVLIVMLFPWQTLFVAEHERAMSGAVASTQPAEVAEPLPDVKVPGVLYTYPELARDSDFPETGALPVRVLKWSRFVAFPAVAIIMLLRIQGRSRRGLRFALGEAEMVVGKEE